MEPAAPAGPVSGSHAGGLSSRRWAAIKLLGAVAAVGFALHFLRDGLGMPFPHWRMLGADPLHDALEFLAAACCLARAAWVRDDRRAWLLIGLGVTSYAIGDTLWFAWLGRGASAPLPSIADAFWIVFYILLIAAVVLLVRTHVRLSQRTLWLDALMGGMLVAAVGITVLFRHGLGVAGQTPAAAVVNLAYPILDVSLVAAMVAIFAVLGWQPGRLSALLGAGAALLGVADTAYIYVSPGNATNLGILRPLYALALLLLGMAAWQRPRALMEADMHRARVLIFPSVFAVASAGLLGLASFTPIPKVAVAFAFLALVCVVLRAWITFSEIRALAHTREQAVTDELTGLGNRRLLYQRVEREIAAADPATRFALLLIDLDRFKDLNDALGHHVGDIVLSQLGGRLRDALRPGDLLVRLGGDEFAVVVSHPAGSDVARQVAAGIRAALADPFVLEGIPVQIDASIGASLYPAHGDRIAPLLRHADMAMYQAKTTHAGFEVYRATADHNVRDRLVIVGELRTAILRDELVVYYQPKASLATGQITGAEALLRWQHPRRGLLGPGAFIPAAEQTGIMRLLTGFVLDRALADCSRWNADGHDLSVAVNLATLDLMDPELPVQVGRLLAKYRVAPNNLCLEVTENVVTSDPTRVEEVLQRLAGQGVQIALDDYGTGYSSLARLARLAVNELKIDRSFVAGMITNPGYAAIVRSTIDLARHLQLLVVAEGVEHTAEWNQLAAYGCHQVQGYLLSPPVPADEFEQLVARIDPQRPALSA